MKYNLNIVITMAGLGKRFWEAGYKVPKYMVEVGGKTLFEWSMISLESYRAAAGRYIFIVRKEDNSSEFIKNSCKKMGLCFLDIIEIGHQTDGQATTAMLAKECWNEDSPLMIYNIDTYVEPGELRADDIKGDGYIPCFNGDGNHWSFVRLNEGGLAVEVREKTRISDYCTVGAYYFKSCRLFEDIYHEYYDDLENMEKGEKYIAPMYNHLIQRGGSVFIAMLDKQKVHVLGTPQEVELFAEDIGRSKKRLRNN